MIHFISNFSFLNIFFYNATATTKIYTLSLHDALPIFVLCSMSDCPARADWISSTNWRARPRSEEHTSELQSRVDLVCRLLHEKKKAAVLLLVDRVGVRLRDDPDARPAGVRDFFFKDTATTEIYTLSLHDALPISARPRRQHWRTSASWVRMDSWCRQTSEPSLRIDRKSTRLNSSHEWISYAVFCLKKKKKSTGAVVIKIKKKGEEKI